ncbi:MAG: peptide chain release factor-like protein [Phycisphaeraceae bacterium]|nr:peptide chain release factor-like protein [Phycisphaeraceae bacterium]
MDVLRRQCEMTRGKTTGPGGQHRNKVSTAVQLTHTPTGLTASASERRSPAENERVALKRLRFVLAINHRIGVPVGDQRTDLWKQRCTKGQVRCSASHADFPSLIAEALDMLDACGWDHNRASLRLDVTPSQLTKLVAKHTATFAHVNDQRAHHGMRKLHA